MIIARTRFAVVVVLFLLAALQYVLTPEMLESRVYLAVALAAVPVAGLTLLIERRLVYRWWIGHLTSVLDVTLVTAAMAAFLAAGHPLAAANSPILFSIYFLALAATTMRVDHRATALAGLAACAQYAVVLTVAAGMVGPIGPEADVIRYGAFDLRTQFARLLFLMAMGIIAVVGTRRMRRPHVLSANDALTGLLNRRSFQDRWEGEVGRARRHGRPISVAAIDIDYFKQFNDTYGHAAGDTALRSASRVLRARVRAGDFVARLGGEEFAVALPETSASDAVALAEQLRKAIAANPITLPGRTSPVRITVSIGVASWPEHGAEISRLLDRADDRLYEAKLAGRDQVKGPSAHAAPVGSETR